MINIYKSIPVHTIHISLWPSCVPVYLYNYAMWITMDNLCQISKLGLMTTKHAVFLSNIILA